MQVMDKKNISEREIRTKIIAPATQHVTLVRFLKIRDERRSIKELAFVNGGLGHVVSVNINAEPHMESFVLECALPKPHSNDPDTAIPQHRFHVPYGAHFLGNRHARFL
jgi:hypothetical protein